MIEYLSEAVSQAAKLMVGVGIICGSMCASILLHIPFIGGESKKALPAPTAAKKKRK